MLGTGQYVKLKDLAKKVLFSALPNEPQKRGRYIHLKKSDINVQESTSFSSFERTLLLI